jgi:hypothetical protein
MRSAVVSACRRSGPARAAPRPLRGGACRRAGPCRAWSRPFRRGCRPGCRPGPRGNSRPWRADGGPGCRLHSPWPSWWAARCRRSRSRCRCSRRRTHVVEHEEFGFGADIDGVANAGGLHEGFGALGGRTRVAGVEFAGRGLDDVADQDQHRGGREGIDIDRVEVGLQDHVRLVDGLPASIDEPSNIRPFSSSSSPRTEATMVRCCHLPLGSVKRRSTHSISSSLIRARIRCSSHYRCSP